MQENQRVIFNLLKEIDEICKKYNITYYAAGGTTIGAARHKGFIPWDDDADIYMKRDEFYKFREAFKKENPKDRELGCLDDNPDYPGTIPRYIDTSTTNIARFNILGTCAAGVVIDIFILDPIPSDAEAQRRQRNLFNVYSDFVMPYYSFSSRNDDDYLSLYQEYYDKADTIGYRKMLEELQEELFSFPEEECDAYMLRWGSVPHVFSKSMFMEPVYLTFEGEKLPMPTLWYEYLVQLYGPEWMYLPPFVEDEGHLVVSNMNLPYKIYEFDAKDYIDKERIKQGMIKRKALEIEVQKLRRPYLEKVHSIYSKYVERAELKKIEALSIDLEELFKNKKFNDIFDAFSTYIKAQLSPYFVGSLSHMNMYRNHNPIIMNIPEKYIYYIAYSYAATGSLRKALKLIELMDMKGRSNKDLESLHKVLLKTVEIIREFYFGEIEKAKTLLEDIAMEIQFDFIVFRRIALGIKVYDGENFSGDFIENIMDDGDVELLKFLGDYYYNKGERSKGLEIYKSILPQLNNGILLRDLKEKGFSKEVIIKSKKILQQEEAPKTEVGKKYLQLLREIDDICKKHDIKYSLADSSLLYAKKFGVFESEEVSPEIVMTAENAETFINAMNLENPESRRLDSMKTDNRYQEFELYYGDTNSAYIDFIKGYKDYVHVVIKILKRRGCKFRGVVTRSLEIANRLNHAEYYKIKKKNRIAKSLSNIGLGIYGGKNYQSKLFDRIMKESKKGKSNYYISTNDKSISVKYSLKENLVQEYSTMKLYGYDFMVFRDYDLYLKKAKGKFAEETAKLRPKKFNTRIADTYVSRDEMLRIFDEEKFSLHEDTTWSNYAKSYAPARNSNELNKEKLDAFKKYRRTDKRILLSEKFLMKKNDIIKAYKEGRYDFLLKELRDYDFEAREFYNYKLGINFDEEITAIYLKLLENNGEVELAKKMRENILKENLKPLNVDLINKTKTTEV